MTRLEQLIGELKERKPICTCGARAYPRTWMRATREKAVAVGALIECSCGDGQNVYLRFPEPVTTDQV